MAQGEHLPLAGLTRCAFDIALFFAPVPSTLAILFGATSTCLISLALWATYMIVRPTVLVLFHRQFIWGP